MTHTSQYLIIILSIAVSALFSSCNNTEGYGGNSNVEGVLMIKYYNNNFTILQDIQPAIDEDIYINFGEEKNMGDDVATSFSGNFSFNYLIPGKYTLYYMSDDTSGTKYDDINITKNIELIRGETLTLDTLYTYKALNWNDGHAEIHGTVKLINYTNESVYPNLEIKDDGPVAAQDIEIYIVYNNESNYSDRIRTQGDGSFSFPNLLKGHYRIYLYSENVITRGSEDIVRSVEVEITETNQVVELEEIIIEKI